VADGKLRWESSGFARPAPCEVQEIGAHRGLCRARRVAEFSCLITADGQLRLAQHAAQDSYQEGLIFAELSREILVV